LSDLKKYDEALIQFDKAIQMDYKSDQNFIVKGDCMRNLNQLNEAIKCYEEAIRINPKNSAAYYGKAKCLQNKKDLKAAITELEKACEIDPNNSAYKCLRNSTNWKWRIQKIFKNIN
jgi:tetratricopeptide (TPR) repeat protein